MDKLSRCKFCEKTWKNFSRTATCELQTHFSKIGFFEICFQVFDFNSNVTLQTGVVLGFSVCILRNDQKNPMTFTYVVKVRALTEVNSVFSHSFMGQKMLLCHVSVFSDVRQLLGQSLSCNIYQISHPKKEIFHFPKFFSPRLQQLRQLPKRCFNVRAFSKKKISDNYSFIYQICTPSTQWLSLILFAFGTVLGGCEF